MNTSTGGVRRRAPLYVGAAGMVALAALTAVAVVALGSSPGSADTAAHPQATASGTASGGASGTPRATASATVSRTAGAAATSAAARPAGRVAHGVHSGDLRFFLLPLPAGADSYGDPAGSALNAGDIEAAAEDPAAARRLLTEYDFRSGAFRTYLTADGDTEVTVRLERFASPAQAAAYYASYYYEGVRITLGTPYPARAYRLPSASAESTETVIALSYEGDVCFTVSATGASAPSRATVRSLVDAQHHRLATGR